MADRKNEETFKVIDRRHFTEEGNLRPEVVELERREEEAAAKEAAAKKAAAQRILPRSQRRALSRILRPRVALTPAPEMFHQAASRPSQMQKPPMASQDPA